MCQVNPKYEKFVVIKNGKKVLYLQLLKALYGCVQSALLWYNLFTNTLVQMGFKLNPYDLCVANSQIKGKQCTVAWYVDDNKISHADDTVVTVPLILGADSLAKLKSWVDTAYAVHNDMKSHTGGATSLGRGAIMCKSTKQKLNTKSSTEAKVVGSSDYLPNTIWARMLLAEQGYELTENIFYQDNQSAIRLEKNGRASCGQKSRHIGIRHFFMQDRFESEGISVVYCPTDEMLANFFTKPLQGSLFRKFRAVLLGHCHVNTLTKTPLPPSKERVENSILEKVRSGASGQTFASPTKKKVSEQMEVASVPTYASILKKGLKWAPVSVSFFLINPIVRTV